MTIVRNLLLTGGVLVAAVVLVQLLDRLAARRRRRAGHPPIELHTPDGAAAQGIRPANSGGVMILVTVAAVAATLAAVLGFVDQDATGDRNRSDDATVNRSTCLSTANADWRAAVGVLLIGYVAGEGQSTAFVEALEDAGGGAEEEILDGADTTEEIRDRGVELLLGAIVNDARIGSETDPLCPFVAGDPSKTPSEPDRTDVDVEPGAEPEISTTTTSPP